MKRRALLALPACLLTSLTGCASFVPAPKVNFGNDRQVGITSYLRQCAATPLPGIGNGDARAVTGALAGDAVVDSQESDCLRVGAGHIGSTQKHYGAT